MRRLARSLPLTVILALTVGLSAAPTPAAEPSQLWQQQLNVARKAKSQNDWDVANAAYARAAAVAEESFAANDERLARTLEEASRGWLLQWDKNRAIEAQQRAIEIRRVSERANASTALADALHAMGKIHQRFGDAEAAEPFLRQALELRESALGTDHAAVGSAARDLSAAIADVRPDDEEAEDLMRRTVAIDETPANHARVGTFYAERDEHGRALEEFRAAIELEENRPMPRLSELVSLWSKIGEQYLTLDLYEDAEAALLTALELREERLGPNHPYLAFTLKKLATVYVEAERYVEAEGLLLRATALNEAAWGGTNHHCGCDTTALLLEVDEALGRREGRAARTDVDKRDVEADEDDAEKDPAVAEIEDLEERAEDAKREGEIESAIAMMREALALRQEHFGAESIEAAYGLARVAMLLRDQRRYDEAATLWAERLGLLEIQLGHEDPQMMGSLGTMGLLTRMAGDYEASDSYYRRELRARDDAGQNLKVAQVYEALGNMNLTRPDPERAAADFRNAARRWEEMAGPEAPEITRTRTLYARALIDLKLYEDAEAVLTESLDREQDKRYPEIHLLIQILQPLKTVLKETGRADAAAVVEGRLAELRELRRAVHPRDERVLRAEKRRAAAKR